MRLLNKEVQFVSHSIYILWAWKNTCSFVSVYMCLGTCVHVKDSNHCI